MTVKVAGHSVAGRTVMMSALAALATMLGGGCDDDPPSAASGGAGGSAAAGGSRGIGGQAGGDAGPADGPGAPALLDLIILIDDTSGMEIFQQNLGRSLPRLMDELRNFSTPPDLRIAFLSSNFGAGGAFDDVCKRLGDAGRFRVKPGCGLDPATGGGPWLQVDAEGQGNFQGDLGAVLDCLADLGTGGCPFEHHLASLRGAFSPTLNLGQRTFLRPDAHLGIIILANEDDCSAWPDTRLFGEPTPGRGPSFRCATAGHTCDGLPIPSSGDFQAPLRSCQALEHAGTSADRAGRLINVSELVKDIKALKPGREDVISVSVLTGWDDRPTAVYRTGSSGDFGALDLLPVCRSSAGEAPPGLRLRTFARSFSRHGLHSICSDDYGPILASIGAQLAGMMQPPP